MILFNGFILSYSDVYLAIDSWVLFEFNFLICAAQGDILQLKSQ